MSETFAQGILLLLGIIVFVNLSKGTLGEWVKARLFNTPIPAGQHAGKKATSSVPGSLAAGDKRGLFLGAVQKYLGVPYVYAGTSPSGVDCSGLVVLAARDVGITGIPRTSQAMFSALPQTSSPVAGDLVFFDNGNGGSQPDHVAVYLGGGQMISADHPGTVVQQEAVFSGVMGYRTLPGVASSASTGAAQAQGALV